MIPQDDYLGQILQREGIPHWDGPREGEALPPQPSMYGPKGTLVEAAKELQGHAWLARFRDGNNQLSPIAAKDIAGYIDAFLNRITGGS
jgi:hypothetical protein